MIDLHKVILPPAYFTIIGLILLICPPVLAQNKHGVLIDKYKKHRNSNLDSAQHYAFSSLLVANTPKEKATSYFYLGWVAYHSHMYGKSVAYYEKALSRPLPKKFELTIKNNLANSLTKNNEVEKAFELINEVKKEREATNHTKLHRTYAVLAGLFSKMNYHDSSLNFYQRAMAIRESLPNKQQLRVVSFWDLSDLHLAAFRSSQNPQNLQSAISFQNKILAMRALGLVSKNQEIKSLARLGHLYFLMGKHSKALQLLNESIRINKGYDALKIEAMTSKVEVHIGMKRNKLAHQQYEKASRLLGKIMTKPGKSKLDFEKLRKAQLELERKYSGLTKESIEKNESLRSLIWVLIVVMVVVVLLVGGMFWYNTNLARSRRKEDQIKIEKGKEMLLEQKNIADQNLNDFLKMARDKQALQERHRNLQEDLQQELAKKDLEFFGQVLRVELEARVVQVMQNLVTNEVDHKKMEDRLGKFYKDLSRLNSLTNSFLQLRPYFSENLAKFLEKKGVTLTQKQQRLCMLLAAKDMGIDNSVIQVVFGYKDHTGLKTLRDRTAKKMGVTLKELDGFLIELSKKKPFQI